MNKGGILREKKACRLREARASGLLTLPRSVSSFQPDYPTAVPPAPDGATLLKVGGYTFPSPYRRHMGALYELRRP